MAFDLERIQRELRAAPLVSPYPLDLSVAVLSDVFRMAGVVPPARSTWAAWTKRAHKLWGEQMGMLAHALASTVLREETVRAIGPRFDPSSALEPFFEAVKPLTAEMIRANAFRQEEFLRKWIAAVGGAVAGESEKESKKRAAQLDYRQTLAEYDKAEAARKAEAERRAKLLQQAAQNEAAARGWRE
jgi:hypothetical protein